MKNLKPCTVNKDSELFGLFRYLNKQMELSFNARLENLGLTSQQGRAIFFIHYHAVILQELVKQSDLERHLRLSKSTISGLVKRLTNNGFIEKADANHHYAINLTEKAILTVSNFKKANEEIRAKLLQGFSKEEIETTKCAFKRMIDNMEGKNYVEKD